MFTGIIEEVGVLTRAQVEGTNPHLAVHAPRICAPPGLSVGESVAIDGVCLTVRRVKSDGFEVDVMPVTVALTNTGTLRAGARVNLERALSVGSRMGGHMVMGHVDGIGRVRSIGADGPAVLVEIDLPERLTWEMVDRGSVCIDGVSLTIAKLAPRSCTVSLVRQTRAATTLADLRPGASVNIETDIVGKYVNSLVGRLAASGAKHSGGQDSPKELDLELLRQLGF